MNNILERIQNVILSPTTWDTEEEALAEIQRLIANRDTGDGLRECENCGDEVAYLSSDDLCDSCAAMEECSICGERYAPEDLGEKSRMCDNCLHDAYRSGWNGEA